MNTCINWKHTLMKLLLTTLPVLGFVLPVLAQPLKTLQQADIIIRHANVITMTGNTPLPDQILCIKDNCITYLGADKGLKNVATQAQIVDATNQYLMPGMAEMHAHLPAPQHLQNFFVMNLMAGVTTVRSMRGKPEHLLLHTPAAYPKPRLYLGAPIITHKTNLSPSAADSLVTDYKYAGYDFLKLIVVKDDTSFTNLMKAANAQDMPVCGHTPGNVSFDKVLQSGYRSTSHMDAYVNAYRKGADTLAKALELTQQHNVYNDATLDWYQMYYQQLPEATMQQRYGMALMHDTIVRNWHTEFAEIRSKMTDSAYNAMKDKYTKTQDIKLAILKQMADKNIPILTGMDAGDPYMVWGYDIVEEMKLFKRAGLSNYQILQAATSTPAKYFKQDKKWGTIAKGKDANLVLLNANPLEDITAISHVNAVIVNGKAYTPGQLKSYLN
jgi:hypothetical protein